MWFKEYVFNIIIQPFHLLIYTILVGSAMELATTSLIYAIIAIYFVIPAEKLLRKFFGFDNAGTLSAAGSFAGGALFSAMINRVNRPKPPEPKDEPEKLTRGLTKSALTSSTKALDYGAGPEGSGGEGPAPTGGTDTKFNKKKISGGKKDYYDSNKPKRKDGGDIEELNDLGEPPASDLGGRSDSDEGSPSDLAGGSPVGPIIPTRAGYSAEDDAKILADLTSGPLPNVPKDFKGKWKDRVSRGGEAIRGMAYHADRKMISGAKSLLKTGGRRLRRTAVGALGAGTMGMVALGAGAATGDPAKAAALALSAGTAGYNFTNYYGDRITKGAVGTAKAGYAAYWGDDLKARQQHKFDEQFKRSTELREALMKTYGDSKKVKEVMDSGLVQALLNNGHADAKTVAKTSKLMDKYWDGKQETKGRAMEKAVAMANWHRGLPSSTFTAGTRENDAFKRMLAKQMSSLPEDKRTEEITRIMDDLESYDI